MPSVTSLGPRPLRGASLVLVEHPRNPTAAAALRRLAEAGLRLTLVHNGSAMPAEWPSMESLVADTRDWRAVTESLCHREVDAVLSFSHHFCSIAAAVAASLGVRGLDPCALRLCADKSAVRHALRHSPFSVTHRVLRAGDVVEIGPELRYPIVVKPVGDTSSTLVTQVDDEDALKRAVARIRVLKRNRKGFAQHGTVLLEQYVPGPEYSVETMTLGGRTTMYGVTAKLPLPEHPFVEQADSFPDPQSRVNTALATAAESILQAIPGFSGPAHLEMRLTPRGPRLIEVNARQPGGFLPELVRATTGHDIFVETVCGVLEVTPLRAQSSTAAATWWQIYAPRAGRVTRCHMPAAVRAAPGVAYAALNVSPGDEVVSAGDNHSRIGDLVVFGGSVTESRDRAALLAASLAIDVDDSATASTTGLQD